MKKLMMVYRGKAKDVFPRIRLLEGIYGSFMKGEKKHA